MNSALLQLLGSTLDPGILQNSSLHHRRRARIHSTHVFYCPVTRVGKLSDPSFDFLDQIFSKSRLNSAGFEFGGQCQCLSGDHAERPLRARQLTHWI